MKKTTMFRKFLNKPGLRVVPCAYDCMSARMAESVGFKALFMTGYGIRDAQMGMPDFGIATATEVVNIVRNMVNSVDIPLIVDADDGYGGALAAYRTTQELIRAGAAGMFIDDQKHPTKCPAIGTQEVVPIDDYIGKLGAVMEARAKEDKDFFICARTDALRVNGVDDMLARAKAAVAAGADMLLPQGLETIKPKSGETTKDVMKQIYKKMGAPKVWIWGSGPEEFTTKDYEDIGAKMWVPGNPLPGIAKVLIRMYKGLYEKGSTKSFFLEDMPADTYLNKLRRLDFWQGLEKKYVTTAKC
jgi:2,3-dimethylmalate lyase